jgi:hypothetical protein
MGAELFHAVEWTDMTEPKVAFRSFANALNLSETYQDSQFSVPDLKREPPEYSLCPYP